MTELIQANIQLLDQSRELLQRLDTATYNKTSPVFLNSAIGGHMRHCLEHYQSLLSGIPNGRINYDLRARDHKVETNPQVAQAKMMELTKQLAKLDANQLPETISVLMDHGADSSDGIWQSSSMGREFQFLISHTIHHFALIAGLCRLHGVSVCKDFGVAPSTLRHRASMSS